MKKNLSNQSPREDWTLEELGQFAQQVAKRTAHDAWLLGRAYAIAKAKAKAEGQKIEAWRKEWVPFLSQPTLSRYEAVSKLPEDGVKGKGLTDVYRLIGLAPQKTAPAVAAEPTNAPPAGDSAPGGRPAEAEHAATGPFLAGVSPQPPAYTVVPAEAAGEADSLLKRLASVVALLHSIVIDMPSLDVTDDATPAVNDAISLLQQVRAELEQKAAA